MAFVMMVLLLFPAALLASLKENMAEHRSHQMGFFFILYGLSILPPLSKHRQNGAAHSLVPLSFPHLLAFSSLAVGGCPLEGSHGAQSLNG